MHRTIEIAAPAAYTDELLRRLGGLDTAIGLSVARDDASPASTRASAREESDLSPDRVLGSS